MTDDNGGYQHVVVALDGGVESWAAFDEALRLARASNGRLDALVAIPEGAGRDLAGVAEQAAARAGTYPAAMFVVAGEPAAAIVRHAEQHDCDLIVMGCRSRIGAHPATSASTTTAVSDRTRVPLLMVRHIGESPAATRS